MKEKTNLSISKILDETNNPDYSELYIWSQYSFAPYSETENTPLTNPIHDIRGDLLRGFKKDQSEEWQRITDNDNIKCN